MSEDYEKMAREKWNNVLNTTPKQLENFNLNVRAFIMLFKTPNMFKSILNKNDVNLLKALNKTFVDHLKNSLSAAEDSLAELEKL